MAWLDDLLKDIPRPQLIRYVAIYFLIVGIFSLCGAVALMGLGGLGAVAGTVGIAGSGVAGVDQGELAAASGALAGASIFAFIGGILSFISGVIMLIVAAGLFQRARWARMGVVVAAGLNALSSLLGLFTGGGIFNLLWLLLGLVIAYLFYTDERIKQEFGEVGYR